MDGCVVCACMGLEQGQSMCCFAGAGGDVIASARTRTAHKHNTPPTLPIPIPNPNNKAQTERVLESMGVGSWSIHRHPQSLAEVFPLDAIVYLSPDAEELLDVGTVFVVV